MASVATVSLSKLRGAFRLDAECWLPEYVETEATLLKNKHRPLREVTKAVRKGVFDIGADNYVASGVPFYRSSNVGRLIPNEAEVAFIPPALHAQEAKTALRRGDVMLAKTGKEGASVILVPECNVSQDVIAVRVDRGEINPFYLAVFLNTRFGTLQMRRWFQGPVQAHLTLPDARDMLIALPPKGFQDGIEQEVLSVEAKYRESRNAAEDAEATLLHALGLTAVGAKPVLHYVQAFGSLAAQGRYDAEFFNPRYQHVIDVLSSGGKTLSDVASLAKRRFNATKAGEHIDYIEIGNIVDGIAQAESVPTAEAPSRAQLVVRPGDVITSTVRPIRRLTAVVQPAQDGFVCSSGFAVLTPNKNAGVSGEVLLAYLRLPIICEILDLYTTATMYPAIPVDRLLGFPFLRPSAKACADVEHLVRKAFAARAECGAMLNAVVSKVEAWVEKHGSM